MIKASVGTVILAVALLGWPAAGQSIAGLMQKGIYTQETVGDLDGAIKIYRQVIGAGTEAHGYTAQALYRLGLCLQAKGDAAGAAQAFQNLVKNYPEERELAAKAAQHLSEAEPRLQLRALSLVLPPGWKIKHLSGVEGARVDLHDPESQASTASVAAGEEKAGLPEIERFFSDRQIVKETQRRTEGLKDWTIRPESMRRFQINGREAASALADYTEGGKPRIEFVVWMRTERTRVVAWFQGIDPANLNSFLARVQPLVNSLVVP